MKLRISSLDAVATVFVVGSVFYGGNLAGDPGLGWHIKFGELVARNFHIPRFDPFVYEGTRAWISNQWLSDVLFGGVLGAGGWPLLHCLTLLICNSAFLLIPAAMVRGPVPCTRTTSCGEQTNLLSPVACALALALTAACGSLQWMIRPVIMSFLSTAVALHLLRFLVGSIDGKFPRWYWLALPSLYALWANMHPAVMIGIVLLIGAGCEVLVLHWRELRRCAALLVLLVISAFATLLNPFGWRLHQSALSLVADPYFMRLNKEWLPPALLDSFFLPFTFLAALFMVLMPIRIFRTPGVKSLFLDVLFPSLLLIMSLFHRRYIPFFALSAFVPLAWALQHSILTERFCSRWVGGLPTLGALLRRGLSPTTVARTPYAASLLGAVVVFVTVTGHMPLSNAQGSGPDQWYPADAIKELADHGGRGMIFSSPNVGGYITYRLWPQFYPFIDDRNELHGERRYREYFQIVDTAAGWQDTLRHIDPQGLLISVKSPLATALQGSLDWQELYQDKEIIALRRRR